VSSSRAEELLEVARALGGKVQGDDGGSAVRFGLLMPGAVLHVQGAVL